jgi:hypothetical protein
VNAAAKNWAPGFPKELREQRIRANVLNSRLKKGRETAVGRGFSKQTAELARKGLVSRTEACKLLDLSRSAIRAIDGVQLTPITVDGTVYYQRGEIDMLLSVRSGVSAQKAFAVFKNGGGPADAVLEHALPPELAERLWNLYLRLRQQQSTTIVIELPIQLTATAWRRAHGYDQITPEIVRAALELCAHDAQLRERVLSRSVSSSYRERKG